MRTTDQFEDYVNGLMGEEDRRAFEGRLASDPVFADAYESHRAMIDAMRGNARRQELRSKLSQIHERSIEAPYRRSHGFSYWRTVAVAASTAVVAVLSTILMMSKGGYLITTESNQYMDLQRKFGELRATNGAIVQVLKEKNKPSYAPPNFEGSAFAINNKGYIITSYHTVMGADSVFIRNSGTERTPARLVLTDPRLDLAVLKIDDADVVAGWQVPFALRDKTADISEKVFTLGYPRNEMVYGEGSLSSLSGFFNDTTMYQISIPVNPGNSGGPLLDDNGNVIGVIRGKISGAEATGFAVKTGQILQAITEQAPDSVKKDIMSNVKKSSLRNVKRPDQVKKINPYVFNVLVYKME